MSVNAASDEASCPINWRLFLPGEWDQDNERRAKAHVPQEVHHRPKWQLVLDMLDELAGWGLEPSVVCGDGAYGDITEFRMGLAEREISYVLDAKAATSALPESAHPERLERNATGRPPAARYRGPFSNLRELALAAGGEQAT